MIIFVLDEDIVEKCKNMTVGDVNWIESDHFMVYIDVCMEQEKVVLEKITVMGEDNTKEKKKKKKRKTKKQKKGQTMPGCDRRKGEKEGYKSLEQAARVIMKDFDERIDEYYSEEKQGSEELSEEVWEHVKEKMKRVVEESIGFEKTKQRRRKTKTREMKE